MKTISSFLNKTKIITVLITLIFSGSMYAGSGAWGKNNFRKKEHKKHSYNKNHNNQKNHKNKGGNKHHGNRKCNDNTDSVPLDGGLGLLLLGAAAFGVKKLRKDKND